jgi:hypothetical protein
MADEMAQGAPAAAPAEGAAPADPAAQGQALEQMVATVGQGLDQLAQAFGQADPAAGEQLGQIAQAFVQVIQGLGGGEEPQAEQAQAPVPAQAGVGETVPAF